jgi:deoxyribonuclease-4
MPMLGAHRATTGGVAAALPSGDAIRAEVIQVFTTSPRRWEIRPLDADAQAAWAAARARSKVKLVVAHDSYLTNLASADDAVRDKSGRAFAAELERCARLGIPYLVSHPGAHVGGGAEVGLERYGSAVSAIYEERPALTTTTLLETTAGQGSCLGRRFEELAWLLARIAQPARTGVCLDTCHVFAAGWDIRTAAGVTAMLARFDAVIGLDRLKLLHLNDSQGALGSRVDRHERIGRGQIGDECFATLLREPRLAHVPMLVETPGLEYHGEELKHLRRLAKGARHARRPAAG